MPATTLTQPGGPVVVSEMTFRALASIRKLNLIPQLYDSALMSRSVYEAVLPVFGPDGEQGDRRSLDTAALADRGFVASPELPWLYVANDCPDQPLPERVASPQHASDFEAATLRLAVAVPASLVLIDGPIKEKAKLSFIKCEGTVSLLVSAFREGHLSAVKPMVVALEKLGHGHVLPPPDMLEALWTALAKL